MNITWEEKLIKIRNLKDFEHNPRKMSKVDFDRLVRDIKEDGYHKPILINTDNTIIGGHARKKALLKAGFVGDNFIRVLFPNRELNEDEIKRINVKDNLPFGEFDFDCLANHFDTADLIDWGMPEDLLIGKEGTEEATAEETPKKKKECPNCGELL